MNKNNIHTCIYYHIYACSFVTCQGIPPQESLLEAAARLGGRSSMTPGVFGSWVLSSFFEQIYNCDAGIFMSRSSQRMKARGYYHMEDALS